MYFYRYSPRNTHLHKYEAELHQAYLDGKCKRVMCEHPFLKAFKYFEKHDGDWMYFLIDTKAARKVEPVISSKPSQVVYGFCALTKIARWVSHQVSMMYVNPDVRGQGIGSLVYDSVLRDKIILVSGLMQSMPARHLWVKLAQNPNYVVWAQDLLNLERTDLITVENGEIYSSLKLYNDIKTKRRKQKEDIRLVAVLNDR